MGIQAEGEEEWNAREHGGPKRRIWRRIHIGIDKETLEVRTVEVTSSNVRDAPELPDLLHQIPANQGIGSFTADGAYDTRKCHEAIAARNTLFFLGIDPNPLFVPNPSNGRIQPKADLLPTTRSTGSLMQKRVGWLDQVG